MIVESHVSTRAPSEPLRNRRLMRPYALVYFYRRRLRVHGTQELFAVLGVTVSVALVFAVTLANASIAGSAERVARAVVGPATLQLRGRSGEGFSASLLRRVEALPGVRQAAPLLEQTASITTAAGHSATVDLAGTDVSLATLNGLAHTLPLAALSPGGIGISRQSAGVLGLSSAAALGTVVELRMRGLLFHVRVSAVLGPEAFGALSQAQVAVMPLERLQALARVPGEVSRVLVQPDPGQQRRVRAELQAIAGEGLTVLPSTQDVTLLRKALVPSDEASALFAAISILIGFLFVFNATLLTVPERRQTIADLRLSGTRRPAIVQMVLFEALCLGVAASALGLLVGYGLSVGVLHSSPGYLSRAFALGEGTELGWLPVLVAVLGGVLAACLAALLPLFDLRRRRAVDAVYQERGSPGNALAPGTRERLFVLALALLAGATVLFVLLPSAALIACLLLALATVLALPLMLAGVLSLAGMLARRLDRLTVLPLALGSLRATSVRSLALAATGALALFGSVALGSGRADLLRGIDGYAAHYVAGADVWVINPGDNQAIDPFYPDGDVARLRAVAGVSAVHVFQGSFFDLGDRRVWLIAWPEAVPASLLAGQVIEGSTRLAGARLRQPGWVVLSRQLAVEHHVGVGGVLSLPTPSGERPFRVAATTTNFGWTPGVIVLSSASYAAAWHSAVPTALGVDLVPGTNVASATRALAAALGPASGLEVLGAPARAAQIDSSAGEGLGQLANIAALLVVAAILALAAALTSSIWQRRSALAGLRLSGVRPPRLRRILLVEAALLLGAGCLTGVLAGVYGQLVIDRYLRRVTGFPVVSVASASRPLGLFVLVLVAVLLLAAVPIWLASRVRPTLALDD